MDQVERTCEEVRHMNAALMTELTSLHKALSDIRHMNSRGKSKEIADLIDSIIA
jgi:hypothetical protein